MGQLRDVIRQMVRNEFASRMIAEVKKEKVYRHSNYIAAWSELDTGSPRNEPTDEGSKHDFVRWFMKQYAKENTPLYLEGEDLNNVQSLLQPLVNNPDEFIEALNKNRELVFGNSNFRSESDPVVKIVDNYIQFKKARKDLINTTAFDSVKLDTPEEENAGEENAGEKATYDTDPSLVMKTLITDLLKTDPSESPTKQTVGNRLESSLKKLSKIFDKEDFEEEDIIDKVKILKKAVDYGLKNYVGMFVEHVIEAFKGLTTPVSDADAEKALEKGLFEFAKDLNIDTSLVARNTPDYEVFSVILLLNNDEVKDLIIEAANNPEKYEDNYDRIAEVAMEVLMDEMNKQTNFNSLGIYIEKLPAVKGVREFFGVGEKRGRPRKETSGESPEKPAKAKSEEDEATEEYKNLYKKAIQAYLASKGLTSVPRGRPTKEMMEFIKNFISNQET